jgi:Na+(H+)/acetate symporter ActP
MKKLYSILTLVFLLTMFNNSYAIINTPSTTLSVATTTPKAKPVKVTKAEIATLTVAEMEAKLGQKLTWKQKLAMKLAKKRGGGDGSFGIGFLLGFFLGIIGVLIAYFAFEDEEQTRKGAWWGLGAAILLYILIFALVIASASTV